MAKDIKLEAKLDSPKENHKGGNKHQEVVEVTKGFVKDNLKAQEKEIKNQEKALEKDEARLANIEKTAEAAMAETEKMIAQKHKELSEIEDAEKAVDKLPAKMEVSVENKTATTSKTKGKWDINPLNWARHIGTRALTGIVALPNRIKAKVSHLVARPQQLWSKQFYKDLGKNILKTPKAILTTLSGAVYRPHRDVVKFEDNFKDYGPEFASPTDKSKIVRGGKRALWLAGKATPIGWTTLALPKISANIARGVSHAVIETFEGIRDSKFHWNPMKWNFKPWKFAKTRESFNKAFSWNAKGIPAHGKKETKIIDISVKEEHKKAA